MDGDNGLDRIGSFLVGDYWIELGVLVGLEDLFQIVDINDFVQLVNFDFLSGLCV